MAPYSQSKKEAPKLISSIQILLSFETLNSGGIKEYQDFQTPLFNQNFSANHPGTMTFFARNKCGIEAAQFEINARYRIIERKPDSSKAVKGGDPDYKAKEEDVLELFNRMMDMILKIERKIRELEGVWGSYGNIP